MTEPASEPFLGYIQEFSDYLRCTVPTSNGSCGQGPARWVYNSSTDDSSTDDFPYYGRAICPDHAEELKIGIHPDNLPKSPEFQGYDVDRLRTLAQAVYDAGKEEGLCHDGLMEFIGNEFPPAAQPSFAKIFLVMVQGDVEDIEAELDRLENHFEGVTDSFSFCLGDVITGTPRAALENVHKVFRAHRSEMEEDIQWG